MISFANPVGSKWEYGISPVLVPFLRDIVTSPYDNNSFTNTFNIYFLGFKPCPH